MGNENTHAKILKLQGIIETEQINYQDNSVVSKTIVNKKSGTVTIFAFDEHESLSEHTAPFDAIVHIIDGSAEIQIGGQKHVLRKGQMIIMPANIPHSLKAIEKFKMILTMIKE